MAEKRKDKKGRILKDGESYRSDGRYMYRYTDIRGNRKCIYAQTLDGIDQAAGSITVLALVERYIPQRQGVRYNTKVGYNFVLNLLKKEDFAYRQIKDIKPSDAKQWFIKLHDDGYKYSSITTVRGVLRPAFEMAVEDDIVRHCGDTLYVGYGVL